MKIPFALIKPFMLLYLVTIITFPRVIITAKISNDLISEICRKTRNRILCSKLLKSNRRAHKASSLLQLGKISMDLSKSSAQETKNMIIKLHLRTRSDHRKLKERYKSCLTNYESAIHNLKLSNNYYKSGDFAKAGRYTAAALKETTSCEQNFAESAPADLQEENRKMECLCSVVLVICNSLSGRGFCQLLAD
ncbi:hypothetical protein CDL12_02524 [Handroanthus impetiginosus]|uniref:Pectinesterase inhibitor domain-containing protein n=1 Tax=Handroanthus impetiginosus TaxID=429701 RepID=A0A2G9I4Q0_9LAMI|nr:hypothetical protein CDL12_02524 [Handroanthus impetiginosus]